MEVTYRSGFHSFLVNEGQALGRPLGENWMMQTKILYREKTPKQTFKPIAPVHSKAATMFS